MWTQRALHTLAPLSKIRRPLLEVLKEWYYNGYTLDLEAPMETCQLCGKEGLRYQFGISNRVTHHELLVGSECINKFDLSGISETGDYIDQHQTKIKVKKDRANLIKAGKKKRALHTLIKLKKADQKFDLESTIEVFNDRAKFSPNHLKFIFWRLQENSIKFNASDFSVSIRRNREKNQMRELSERDFLKIKASLTPAQCDFYWSQMHDQK